MATCLIPSVAFCQEEVNYTRMQMIIQKVCQKVLRAYLLHELNKIAVNIDHFLANNKTIITRGHEGKVYERRYFPLDDNNQPIPTNLQDWDIHMLCFILTRFCNLSPADIADIDFIREKRNFLSHLGKPEVADLIYTTFKSDLDGLLKRMLRYLQDKKLEEEIKEYLETVNNRLSDHLVDAYKAIQRENIVLLELQNLQLEHSEHRTNTATNTEYLKNILDEVQEIRSRLQDDIKAREPVDNINHLMENLDAEVICTVKRDIGEIWEHVSLPDEETVTVQKRSDDLFGYAVVQLMSALEKRMDTSALVKEMPEAEKFEVVLKAPATKGNAAYTQWVSKLWQEIAKLKDSMARKFLHPIRAHLECYNNALIIYNDARVDDALRYLKGEMTTWEENIIMDENQKIIYRAYKKLISCNIRVKCSENPKLAKLREMIMESYEGERGADIRGIIFVKTRELARAIVSWMKDTPGLRELCPIQLVGQNMSADKGRMTKVEQDQALKIFREGRHKIIVASAVARERLDIATCDLVIRYGHVTNEISKVQFRGRGRAANKKGVLIAEENTEMAEKEERNIIREVMSKKAITLLKDYIRSYPERFCSEVKRYREEANLDRKLRTRRKLGMSGIGQFELKCLRCDSFICMSDNVKKVKEAHHVVVDETLPERVNFVKGGATRYADDSIQFSGKVICKSCGGNLGVICIYRNLEFPVPKIENFLVVDRNGRQNTCKKWKAAPFVVEKLRNEDFKDILEARGATGDL